MTLETLIIIVVMLTGLAGLYWLLSRQRQQVISPEAMEQLVQRTFGMSVTQVTEQSRQVLSAETRVLRTDLEAKQKGFQDLVKQLHDDMIVRQQELRSLEQDRTRKFAELSTLIDQHRKQTEELQVSTKQLASVLSNNQARGEWGERIIEDLLTANGLVEGIHYLRQTKQLESKLRPDITLLLPNQRFVPVDVKFPFAEIQKMAAAETKANRELHLKQFSIDLKQKIAKVALYIDPSQNTLDYAILFVPNEMIFSFMNQRFPDLIDEAMTKRVMIVSPFTFLIVARTIFESYRHFMIGDQLRDVIKTLDEFAKEWEVFKAKFGKYGRSLDTLKSDYEEITGTRFRQLEKRLGKVRSFSASQPELNQATDDVSILPAETIEADS